MTNTSNFIGQLEYKWEYYYVIPLLPLVGVNHFQPILYMSKIIVYIKSTEKRINQFAIVYMINPTLHVMGSGIVTLQDVRHSNGFR